MAPPRPVKQPDFVSILEAAYRHDESDDVWFENLVRTAKPAIDVGLGIAGFFYDLSNPAAPHIHAPLIDGTPEGAQEALWSILAQAPKEMYAKIFRPLPSCGLLSEYLDLGARIADEPLHRKYLEPLGIRDFLTVATAETSAKGCLFGAPIAEVGGATTTCEAWSKVAAHMAAGLRLRRAQSKPHEAVVTPSGRVEHAEGVAKQSGSIDALKRAVQGMERARGPMRRSAPERAMGEWTALVAGQWSLVDQFEQDGKRYIVALRNAPKLSGSVASLSAREQQVLEYAARGDSNKLIAYELGLSRSTIAMCLSRCAVKLGVKSRVALIQAYLHARTQ